MNLALIQIKSNNDINFKAIEFVNEKIEKFGFEIDEVNSINFKNYDNLKRSIEFAANNFDVVFVLDDINTDFVLRDILLESFDIDSDVDLDAETYIKQFLDNQGIKGTAFTKEFCMLPLNATVLKNDYGLMQGYYLKINNCLVFSLPSSVNECDNILTEAFKTEIEDHFRTSYEVMTFKMFGIAKSNLNEVVNSITKSSRKLIKIKYKIENLDVTLRLIYSNKSPKMIVDDAIREIIIEFKANIYAEEDITLEQRLKQVLILKNKKISVAESFTGGNIIKSIVGEEGASQYFSDGFICYSEKSKIERLGVERETISKKGVVSADVAYEMALGVLENTKADISIATTGYTTNEDEKLVGLSFIAIGLQEGIYVYKYNFEGSRKQIIEIAKNTAIFNAIVKLKEN